MNDLEVDYYVKLYDNTSNKLRYVLLRKLFDEYVVGVIATTKNGQDIELVPIIPDDRKQLADLITRLVDYLRDE